jgi:hypothetical protein
MSIISYISSGALALSSLVSSINPFQTPVYRYCHGSTYSALYLMSRLEGEDKNCLVPFGHLDKQRIPTFSGECFRGISDNGINRTKTSWAPMQDGVSTAVSYSGNFGFSFEKTVEAMNAHITISENHISEADDYPPYGYTSSSANWNRTLLRIRQIRAWDETLFQEAYKEKLGRWLDAELAAFNKKHADYASRKETKIFFASVKMIRQELEAPIGFQLTAEDKVQIMKTYPIVFLKDGDQYDQRIDTFFGSEYGMNKLTLGQEIRGIATSPEHVDEVKAFIHQQGLARRVEVVSMNALPLERLITQTTPKK